MYNTKDRTAWDNRERKNLLIKLHKKYDADILLRLSGRNKSGYIKSLIRSDIDVDTLKKSKCYKCGARSQGYIYIKRFDSEAAAVSLPVCAGCLSNILGV